MTETLWPLLDTAVRQAVDDHMGAGSAYPDHQMVTVEVVETWDRFTPPYPRALIFSNNGELEINGYAGDGAPHLTTSYEFWLIAVGKTDSYASARDLGQILAGRLRQSIRMNQDSLLGIVADDGENSNALEWVQSYIEIRGRNQPGSQVGEFVAVSVVVLSIQGEI